MRHSWPVRLQALVLALLLLGGGGRLPVLDGVVFHHQPGSVPSGTALLAENAQAPHGAADHLAAGFPASGLAPQSEGPVHAAPGAGARDSFTLPDWPRAHPLPETSRPRAPPTHA